VFTPSPDARIDVPWGPREAAWGIVIVIAVVAIAIAVLSAAYRDKGAPIGAELAATLVLDAAMVVSAAILGTAGRVPFERIFGPLRLPTVKLWAWAVLALGTSMAVGQAYVVIVSMFTDSLSPTLLPIDLPTGGVRWLAFAIIVVVGPFSEEIFFRGFVFAGLLQRYSAPFAIVASAALFGAAHLDIAVAGPAFLSGCIFATVYRRSGSLWPLILAHTAQNAIAFAMAR